MIPLLRFRLKSGYRGIRTRVPEKEEPIPVIFDQNGFFLEELLISLR